MVMSKNEKQKIIESARFLEQNGYIKHIGTHIIKYSSDKVEIIISYEPNSNISDITIKFTKENELYSVGWIACVRGGLHIIAHKRLENVLTLLLYLRENYNTILDVEYCRASNELITNFILTEKQKQ